MSLFEKSPSFVATVCFETEKEGQASLDFEEILDHLQKSFFFLVNCDFLAWAKISFSI